VNDILASLVFGTALVVLGGFLVRWHYAAWNAQRNDGTLDDRERLHFRAQFRRRIQIAAMVILVGIILPPLEWLIERKQSRELITIIVIAVLLIALWIMVLAMIDWLSMRVHNRATQSAIAALARKRRELEAEVERLRSKHSNGRH
jgi:hypothetical protein